MTRLQTGLGVACGVLFFWGVTAQAQETSGTRAPEPTALERLRTADPAAGKLKEITLDPAKFNITERAPIPAPTERPTRAALRPPPPPPAPVGVLDLAQWKTEVSQRTRELEACRSNLAAATGLATNQINAGSLLLRWTIMPDGRSRNAIVLEQEATDLDVMKCVRRRMAAWLFTPPTGGPVDVEHTYRFTPLPASTPVAPPVAGESAPKK